MPWYLLLPLVAAIVYSLGSILIKRALVEGVTMDQSFHITNITVGLIFAPLLLFETKELDWSLWWQPVVMGLSFFLGTWLTFLGIRRGDISLVTPILGTKVVFVAIGMVVLTGAMPSPALWLAAFLTAAGIFVMGFADLRRSRQGHLVFTVAVTLGSAAIFGICDVLVSWWSADFGAPSFLALGSIGVAVLSVAMWGLQGMPKMRVRGKGKTWAVMGAVLVGLQAIAIGIALSFFPDATGINVVYASRGLWVIVLVVALGAFLGNNEYRDSGRAFFWRATGAVVVTVAVVIAVLDRAASSA